MNGTAQGRRRLAALGTAVVAALGLALVPAIAASAQSVRHSAGSFSRTDLPLPSGAIKHIMVIELENESESETFGPGSPATYLNSTLLPQGEFLQNYYAVGHVSLDSYIAQVSGQAPNQLTSSDCVTSLT